MKQHSSEGSHAICVAPIDADGHHGVTTRQTLASGEARNVPTRARGEGVGRATIKNKKRQARYSTGFLTIWDVQTSQKTAQNTGLLAFARVDNEKPKSKLNSS